MGLTFKTTAGGGSSGSSAMGKGCGTLFFGVFFLMGALFVFFVLGETWKQLSPWWWSKTDCTITASGVEDTGDDESPYRARVRYHYEVDGRQYEGTRVVISDGGTASYDKARDRAFRYPPGFSAVCRVNPDDPSQAVLERRLPWIALMVFLPLIFVAIGGGGLYATWRASKDKDSETVESISQSASSGKGYKVMIGFGLLFVVVGAAVFIPMTLVPAIRFAESMLWRETPCTIIDGRLRSWSTDDGTSYRADIHYRYEADGSTWTSNRVVSFGFINSGRDASRALLDRNPDGTTGTCWVDPRDPSRSVLERQLRVQHLIGLAPLLFVIAGWAVAHAGWKKMRGSRSTEARMEDPHWATDPLQLEPQVGPAGKVFGAFIFAALWNGIVSVFVWQAIKSWQSGRPDWFLTLFIIPFVLVGIASIGAVGYFLLAVANPRPRLTLTPGRPRLGETLQLQWRFTGRSGRMNHLRIFLEGREEATYQRGTNTYTDTEVLATVDFVDTTADWEMPRGTAELVIPEDTMHSFEADSNKIVWEIKVAGDIARWPDVQQNFPITIRPMRIGGP